MKKIVFLIMVLALMLTQCKKQVDTMPQLTDEMTEVTVCVNNGGDKTDITPTGIVTWGKNDRLCVVGETDGLLGYVYAQSNGDPVYFSGKIKTLTKAQTLRFYYVGDKTFSLDGSGNYTFDVSSQDGTLNGIAAHNQLMFGKTSGAISVGTTDFGTINMNSLMAIAYFKITCDGEMANCAEMTGGFASSTFNAKTYNGGALTGNVGLIEFEQKSDNGCYVALLPGTQTLDFRCGESSACLGVETITANSFYYQNGGNAITVHTTSCVDFNNAAMDVTGLPIWSKANVCVSNTNSTYLNGTTKESWYGDYFAWGEVEPYYRYGHAYDSPCSSWATFTTGAGNTDLTSGYAWHTYSNGAWASGFNEWNTPPHNDIVLKPGRDVATSWHIYSGPWRTPTSAEWEEMKSNTYWVWTTDYKGISGLNGYVVYGVKSKADKGSIATPAPSGLTYSVIEDEHIFLPAAGDRLGVALDNSGSKAYYWSSSIDQSNHMNAVSTNFFSGWVNTSDCNGRYCGFTIRPVK